MAQLIYNDKSPQEYNLEEKSILGMSKGSKCKNVHFDEKMTVHGLICPNEIFCCVRPKITFVIFENMPAIRTLKSEKCNVSSCPDCYF